MGQSSADWQARLRVKRKVEIEWLRQVAAVQAQQLTEARSEIEIAALERENAILRMALAHERKQHAEANARAAKPAPPPIDPDGEIARLKEWVYFLRNELQEKREWYEDESRRKGIMTFSTYGKLMKCLHPDGKPTDAERSEACAPLGQWKQDGDRARRRPARGCPTTAAQDAA
jgi:hypothetical protein